MPDSALPPHLQGTKHWDYPNFFTIRAFGKEIKIGLQWIPRAWTSFSWGVPVLVAGQQQTTRMDPKSGIQGPSPIGEAGSWQISRFPQAPSVLKYVPLYFSFTLSSGRHFRIGARWDDVDSYVTFPVIASRKYTGKPDQDTSTH